MIFSQLSSCNSDEDELGSSDSDSEILYHTFNKQDDDHVLITNQDPDRKAVREQLQHGCGCSFDCYSQFTDEEVFHSGFKCKNGRNQ